MTAALGGRNATTLVFETGRPARIERVDRYADDDSRAGTPVAGSRGPRSTVGAPISVEGRIWGALQVASPREAGLPVGTEERVADFAELVATAIANADAKAQLQESRARIATSADETRRRIERDLHDGAQQRLVSLALQLRAAQAAVPPELGEISAELDRVTTGLTDALDELREYARGIHPALLTDHGLGPALRTLARRCPLPVDLDMRTNGRLPEPVEVCAYYVILRGADQRGQARERLQNCRRRRGSHWRPAALGSRRRHRRRRLHPRHRTDRTQGPRGGTRRPDFPQQPARGGDHPASRIPAHRRRPRHLQLTPMANTRSGRRSQQ